MGIRKLGARELPVNFMKKLMPLWAQELETTHL
jgi:hypothetical protein